MSDFPRPLVAVHQPNHAPWTGWFVKAALADVLVLLDDVQFPGGSWVNRARVMGPGGPAYLTVPVRRPGTSLIREVRIAEPRWAAKHLRRLRPWYHGARGLAAAEAVLDPAGLEDLGDSLVDANEVVIRRLMESLGVATRTVRSSTLGIAAADPTDRHVALCRALGGATYLSGRGGAAYNDAARFGEAGIALGYFEFDHPVHGQGREGFTPGLSALDLLARTGADAPRLLAAAAASARLSATPPASPSG